MMTKPPCKVEGVDCQKRHVGCRAECDDWNKWLAIHKEETDKIKRGKAKYTEIKACMIDQTKRVQQDRQHRYTEKYRNSHGKGR